MSRKLSRNSRRAVVASLLGLTVGGGILASAASLGVTGNTLGAGTVVIASCDTNNVTLRYGHTYVAAALTSTTPGAYRTSSVIISGIADACIGKALDITLKDVAGASLASGNVAAIVDGPTVDDNTATVTFLSPFADATAVEGAAVVIAD